MVSMKSTIELTSATKTLEVIAYFPLVEMFQVSVKLL